MGGDFEAWEDDSRIVSRSILDECVQMVAEGRCLVKKDEFKGVFDADDDVHEGKNENLEEGEKPDKLPRSSWELLRPSSTPRLAALLLKAGASEAQVLSLYFQCLYFKFVAQYTDIDILIRCCLRDLLQLPLRPFPFLKWC